MKAIYMGQVIISPNPKRTKVFIDPNGNEVVPYTKQILTPKQEEYIPTKEEIEKVMNLPKDTVAVIPDTTVSIQQQIENAKRLVADLELQKKADIERIRKELADLEAS